MIEGQLHLHDLRAAMPHLLELDCRRLTYRHADRDFCLTDVCGQPVNDILA